MIDQLRIKALYAGGTGQFNQPDLTSDQSHSTINLQYEYCRSQTSNYTITAGKLLNLTYNFTVKYNLNEDSIVLVSVMGKTITIYTQKGLKRFEDTIISKSGFQNANYHNFGIRKNIGMLFEIPFIQTLASLQRLTDFKELVPVIACLSLCTL